MAKLIDSILSNEALEKIKILCQVENQDVNYFNGTTTPLQSATEYFEDGIVDLIKFLVEQGADINANCIESTLLSKCVRNGLRLQLIDELLKLGANPNIKDNQGRNVLHLSVLYHPDDESQTIALVDLLLSYGVDYEAKKYDGCTPLMDFIRFGNHPSVVKRILSFGADPNASDLRSNTALHYCCDWDWLFTDKTEFNQEVLRLLLMYGADLFSKNCDGETSLDKFFASSTIYCSRTGNVEPMLEVLKFMMIKDGPTKDRPYYRNGKEDDHENSKGMQISVEDGFTELSFLTDEYIEELNKLKLYVLFENTSLYSLCAVTNRRKLGMIFNRLSSIHNLEKIKDDIKMFINYSELMETRLQIGKDWSMILEELENVRFTLWSESDMGLVVLNYDCMQHLFLFLDKIAIKSLILASKEGMFKEATIDIGSQMVEHELICFQNNIIMYNNK